MQGGAGWQEPGEINQGRANNQTGEQRQEM